MKEIKYKGYVGQYERITKEGYFYGKIKGISNLVTFESDKEEDIKKAFHEAVDDYIELLNELNKY